MIEISDIIVAIENKEHFVLDDFIKQGEFCKASNGQLQRFVGGFTAVFPVIVNQEKWAFRCWHTNMKNMQYRCDIVSKAIQNSGTNYLCEFSYTKNGIVVAGHIYPTTRMKWVEGQTIKDYICSHSIEKNRIYDLAKKFLLLCKDMHAHSFAHGDLQHGNIIVSDDCSLYLVDYDSFYCPELKGISDDITGLRDYQHPLRQRNTIMNEKIDYFSELIIYLSIISIAEKPELCKKYQVADSERLLFCADDFKDLQASDIYNDLYPIGGDITLLCIALNEYLQCKNIYELIPFYEKLDMLSRDFDESGRIVINSITDNIQLYSGEAGIIKWNANNADYVLIGKQRYSAIDKYEFHAVNVATQIDDTVTLVFYNKFQRLSRDVTIHILPYHPTPWWKQYAKHLILALLCVVALVFMYVHFSKDNPSTPQPPPPPHPITRPTEKDSPKEQPSQVSQQPSKKLTSGSTSTSQKPLKLEYGIWESTKSPKKIHGKGKLTYTRKTPIEGWPGKTAEEGDYIEGRFENGKPINAEWYSSSGKKKEHLLGSSE